MSKYFIAIFVFLLTVSCLFGQTDEELGLHPDGDTWNFYPCTEHIDSLPNVLLIGNSVMNGYHKYIIDSLAGIANVDYWITPRHLKSEYLFEDLAKVVSFREYEVIQFNIGLHGWPRGRILDEEYVPLLEKYVQTIKGNSPKSQLVWASTTPVTEQDKAELNKEINPVIAERNFLAEGIMKKYNIPVNDLYAFGKNNLQLSRGDKFHWKPEAYKMMAKQSIPFILDGLEAKKE